MEGNTKQIMKKDRISVLVTTYNGEKYVLEQLASIMNQTVEPDEVIIIDDCSSDCTATRIEMYIKEYSLNKWKLLLNKENFGWKKNFLLGMRHVTGDIVFTCDQDDIWPLDRLESMINIMAMNDNILCLAGGMISIDENGKIVRTGNNFPQGGSGKHYYQIIMSNRFASIMYLGCSLCIKREIVEYMKDIDCDSFSYDRQMVILAILLNGMYVYEKTAVYYRIHGGNYSGIRKGIPYGSDTISSRIDEIYGLVDFLCGILKVESLKKNFVRETINAIEGTIELNKKRIVFLETPKITSYIELLKFRQYYRDNTMLLGDYFYAIGLNELVGRVRGIVNIKRLK